MKKYLDPKADLTFKKVFGEHPDLTISFLNAMLPFEHPEDYITSIEYLPAEMVPDNPLFKDSIVDVRCTDGLKRHFIVEMQMYWAKDFEQRVLFNASKAYVRQLDKGKPFSTLQPVYALSLLNDVYMNDVDDYYHHYRLVHQEHTDKIINGLQLVFVELPKFHAHSFSEKRMQVLWLRFLTEINENTSNVSSELMSNDEIRKAVEQVEESAFNKEELANYDAFWLAVSTHTSFVNSAKEEGMAIGIAKGEAIGIEKGEAIGIEKGKREGEAIGIEKGKREGERSKAIEIALNLKKAGVDINIIAASSGLSVEEINNL